MCINFVYVELNSSVLVLRPRIAGESVSDTIYNTG